MTDILVLSDRDIRTALPLKAAVASQKTAYLAATSPGTSVGAGSSHPGPEHGSLVFALTGGIPGETGVCCKFGMQVPSNHQRGIPSVHAFVSILDAQTGVPLACLNGTTITTMRTAAGIAAAADVLATGTSGRLAVIGSGVQAREAVRCIATIRDLSQVRVWSRNRLNCAAAVAELQPQIDTSYEIAKSAREAVEGCDIAVTCTLSRKPVVSGQWLSPGVTLLTVGSYFPEGHETDLEVSKRATRVFVDDIPKALANCGPVQEAMQAGLPLSSDVLAIGDVLAGRSPGRTSDQEILVFHSTGLGIQDACAAWAAYCEALRQGIGQTVAF